MIRVLFDILSDFSSRFSEFSDLNDWQMVKTVLELGANPNVITTGRWTEQDSNQFLAFNHGEVMIYGCHPKMQDCFTNIY